MVIEKTHTSNALMDFNDVLDEDGTMCVDLVADSESDCLWIDKKDAIGIIGHLAKVFNIEVGE